MAFRSLIGGGVRSSALSLRHHLNASSKTVGLVAQINHNNTTNHHRQRFLRIAVAPSSDNPIPSSALRTLGGGSPVTDAYKQEDIILFAQFAVNEINETRNAHLHFVRVMEAIRSIVGGWKYYIVLEARDGEGGGEKKFFATVYYRPYWRRKSVWLLNWKPVEV